MAGNGIFDISRVSSYANVYGDIGVGGLVGFTFSSGTDLIQDSFSQANLYADNYGSGSPASFGGVAGYDESEGIVRSYATGTINNQEQTITNLGGLVGYFSYEGNSPIIQNSFSSGNLS